MNAVEHMVEAYYRHCKNCFTVTDVKIPLGVGRQLDILATKPAEGKFFHVECSVTHIEKWNPHAFWLAKLAEYKFCGYTRPDPKSAFVSEKADARYQNAILQTYVSFGINDLQTLERVWCTWTVQDMENLESIQRQFKEKHGFSFVFLSFRDVVLPALEEFVGTSNYDDDILRTLSLVKQMEDQRR